MLIRLYEDGDDTPVKFKSTTRIRVRRVDLDEDVVRVSRRRAGRAMRISPPMFIHETGLDFRGAYTEYWVEDADVARTDKSSVLLNASRDIDDKDKGAGARLRKI